MKTKHIVLIVIAIFALIQVIRIDLINPETNLKKDFLGVTNAPDEISSILKQSCYDCHSNETVYPWYSKVAPVSWMLKSHVNEGREHLNFSEWADYSVEKRIAIQKECIKEISKDKMPLKSYTLIHSKAKLSEASKASLLKWLIPHKKETGDIPS